MSASKIKAGSAYVELTAKDGKLKAGLKSAESRLARFGSGVKLLQTKLNAGSKWFATSAKGINTASSGMMTFGGKILGVATIVGGALGVAVRQAVSLGDNLDKMSKRTGTSVEWLSAMGYAAEQGGASIDNITDAVKGMNETIAEATAKGTGEGYEWLRQLGIGLADLDDLNTEDKFEKIADAISNVEDHAIRTKAALGIFKGSAEKLLPVLPNIQKDKAEAKRFGLIVSTEQSQNAVKLSDAMTRLQATAKMMTVQIGSALIPIMQRLVDTVTGVVSNVTDFAAKNQGTIVSLAKLTAILGGAGLAIMGLGLALKPMTLMFSAVSIAILGISKSIGFLVSGFKGWFVVFSSVLAGAFGFFNSLKAKFAELKTIVVDAVSAIVDAIKAGDLIGAISIAWGAIKVITLDGLLFVMQAMSNALGAIRDMWSGVVTDLNLLWVQFAGWFTSGITTIGYSFENAFRSAANAMADVWDSIMTVMSKGIVKLAGMVERTFIRVKNLFSDEDVEVKIAASLEREEEIVAAIENERTENKAERQKSYNNRQKEMLGNLSKIEAETDQKLAQIFVESQEPKPVFFDARITGIKEALEEAKRDLEENKLEARVNADLNSFFGDVDVTGRMQRTEKKLPENLGAVMGSFQLRNLDFFRGGGGQDDKIVRRQDMQIQLDKRRNMLLENLASRQNNLKFT